MKMAVEVKYTQKGTPEERIAKRLRNSGEGANPNHVVQKGEGPVRTFHNIHNAGHPVARKDEE
jgi:hypothetical protein